MFSTQARRPSIACWVASTYLVQQHHQECSYWGRGILDVARHSALTIASCREDAMGHDGMTLKKKGNGQKREPPVGSWPETGGQKYEGSKHSVWAHVFGQHHLPHVSGRTPTGTSRFSLLWSALTRFRPHFVAFCCSSPVYSI